jgi:hypothetical protein
MASKCKKSKGIKKDRNIAEMTTRKNKIRKFEKIVRNNPNDHCAINTLAQLYHDSGVKNEC